MIKGSEENTTVLRQPSPGPNGGEIVVEICGDYVHVVGTANVCVSVPVNPNPNRPMLDTLNDRTAFVSVEVAGMDADAFEVVVGNSADGGNTRPRGDQSRLRIERGQSEGTVKVTCLGKQNLTKVLLDGNLPMSDSH